MNKAFKTVLSAALACCGFAFTAQADSISALGGDVTYAGAAEAKTLPDGDVVLVLKKTKRSSRQSKKTTAKRQSSTTSR